MTDREALDSKLSVLFVSADKYPPFRVDSAVLFGEEMTARGHTIDWVLQSEDHCDCAYVTQWQGNTIFVGKTDNGETRLRRLRKHLYWISHQFKIFKLLRSKDYDLLQVKNKFIIGLAAALGARLLRKRFMFWLSYPHAEEALYKVREGVARYPVFYLIKGHVLSFILYRLIMPMADHVFVQSEQMKQDVAERGIPEADMTSIPMGVSLREFEPYRQASDAVPPMMEAGKKSVVYIGTIERVRQMDFMVRVLAQVLQRDPDVMLYFVGDGQDAEDREVIQRAAVELGISDAIRITGFLPREEAMAYVRKADVCVSPFRPHPVLNSTSPTKLVEYMAMDKPVVANDHPEQRLVIGESGCGLCVPYEEKAFADAILELLADLDQAREMGIKGRRYVEQFRDYAKIAEFLEARYQQLLHS